MNYEKFCKILNKHIFKGEKKELLEKIATNPERFIGLFRPTKPKAKILQHLLQSHEIRFGDALEEIIEEILRELRYETLSKELISKNGEILFLDQHFTDGKKIYWFIEQKIRDDHDSTKKRGQISNFEKKLETLQAKYGSDLIGIMYFIDPSLSKNKNYYLKELKKLENFYGVKLLLFYGKELFEYLKHPEMWEEILSWLQKWKDSLPELPEINFDQCPEESFKEIKMLEIRYWRKLLENENIWKEGIMKALFKEGKTLRLLLKFFNSKPDTPYKNLAKLLQQKIEKYF